MSTTPTFNLTWEEVRAVALDGAKVRRESWSQWLACSTGIWRLLDRSGNPVRVVSATDFQSADYLACDWTTDPIGTVRDVCSLPPPTPVSTFTPPSISLSIGTNSLTATLGASSPSGSYQLQFLVNGSTVGVVEATAGATTISTDLGFVVNAQVIATSRLPLPAWSGYATALRVVPIGTVLSTSSISYSTTSPGITSFGGPPLFAITGGSVGPIEPVETITNTWSSPVLVTISGSVDDDVAFNGAIYTPGQNLEPYWASNTVSGAHSFTAAFTLAPGASLAIGCRNNINYSGGLSASVVITVP